MSDDPNLNLGGALTKSGNISVEDAVHCEDGCSALQRRLQCTASEKSKTGTEIASPIWEKRKGRRIC